MISERARYLANRQSRDVYIFYTFKFWACIATNALIPQCHLRSTFFRVLELLRSVRNITPPKVQLDWVTFIYFFFFLNIFWNNFQAFFFNLVYSFSYMIQNQEGQHFTKCFNNNLKLAHFVRKRRIRWWLKLKSVMLIYAVFVSFKTVGFQFRYSNLNTSLTTYFPIYGLNFQLYLFDLFLYFITCLKK